MVFKNTLKIYKFKQKRFILKWLLIKFQGDKNIQVIQNAAIAANFHECFQALEHKYQTACHLLNEEVLLKV